MSLSSDEWLSRLASALGTEPPSPEEVSDLLDVAGFAAHASERTAAPISCWLVARAGVSPAEARRIAEQLNERLGQGDAG